MGRAIVSFMVRPILPFLVAFLALGTPLAAQIVRGVVSDEVSGRPLPGAMAVLLDADSTALDRFLSRDDGSYELDAPHPGRFHVRVDRIGYASLTTETFDVAVDGAYRDLPIPVKPIRLRGLDVAAARRCEVRPEEGAITAQVWTEARKALEAAAWTQETGVYRYTLLHYEREIDRDGEEILDEQRRFGRGSTNAPFVSVPAESLAEKGFVQQVPDSGTAYHAPDAEAFLSDAFLDTHCMGVERGKDGMIGLRFEPIEGRTLSEIEGHLWLDADSARLDRIEFDYVNLRDTDEIGEPGGAVHFTRLPNGTWIVRDWRIRMPVLALDPRGRIRRTGYRDEGGLAWRVTDRDGAIVLEAATATVTGVVYDSIRSVGAKGVSIRVEETGDVVPADADGSFLLPGLPSGLHRISVQHPGLDSLGIRGPNRDVETELGQMVHVTLTTPRFGEALEAACGELPRPRNTAPLFGRVVDRTGAPLRDAMVEISWLTQEGFRPPTLSMPSSPAGLPERTWNATEAEYTTFKTSTDPRGIFLLCDVRYGSRPKVTVRLDDGAQAVEEPSVRVGTDVALVIIELDPGGNLQ